jgi:hypothetical protein
MNRSAIALCAAFIGTAAPAQSIKEWTADNHGAAPNRSYVELHEPRVAGAVASVTFANEPVHAMDERFTLERDGLAVTVSMDWQADDTQAERITVTPPEGYAAVPPWLTLDEGVTDTLHIFKWEGM